MPVMFGVSRASTAVSACTDVLSKKGGPVRHLRSISMVLLGTSASFLTVLPGSAAAATVRGRAYGLYVNMPSRGVVEQHFFDTGWLPPTGGSLGETATNFVLPDVASSKEIIVSSSGDDCGGDSDVVIRTATLLPGHPGQVTFGSLQGSDEDECCEPDGDDPDAALVQELTFGGTPVVVTGEFNQTVTLEGVGDLTINEVVTDDDDDCDEDDFTVNALHLRLGAGEEIIVGSIIFESDDDCCPVPTESSAWSTVKSRYRASSR